VSTYANKVFLVTGAGSDFASAIAIEVAQKYGTVILVDDNIKALEQTYDRLQPNKNHQILPLAITKANTADLNTVISAIQKRYHHIDCVIFYPNYPVTLQPLTQQDNSQFKQTLVAHIYGTWVLIKTLMPLLGLHSKSIISVIQEFNAAEMQCYFSAHALAIHAIKQMLQMWDLEIQNLKQSIDFAMYHLPATETQIRARVFPAQDQTGVQPIEISVEQYLKVINQKLQYIN